MSTLHRITTEYVECEDRVRLTGELASGDTLVLWLTQRLVNRVVPHLTGWLERQVASTSVMPSVQAVHQNVMQGFAQQAARAQLAPEPPVRGAASQAGWRVDVVNIAQSEDTVVLTFKGETEASATLTLASQPLRQWLGIVYEQCLRGEWPTAVWPAWMEQAQRCSTPGTRGAVLH